MGCIDGVLLSPVLPVSHISNSLAPGCLNITVLTQYFAIYDADGSLAGELSYALGKLAGARRCALCDISHGWNPLASSESHRDIQKKPLCTTLFLHGP